MIGVLKFISQMPHNQFRDFKLSPIKNKQIQLSLSDKEVLEPFSCSTAMFNSVKT